MGFNNYGNNSLLRFMSLSYANLFCVYVGLLYYIAIQIVVF